MPRKLRSPRSKATRIALALLLPMLLMASCGQVVSKPVLVNRDPPGPDLTDCPEETPPEVWPFPDEAARYRWSAAAIGAGRECREVLRKAKDWMLKPPADRVR